MNGHSLNGRLGGVGLLSSFRLSPLTLLLHCDIVHVLNIFSRWKGNLRHEACKDLLFPPRTAPVCPTGAGSQSHSPSRGRPSSLQQPFVCCNGTPHPHALPSHFARRACASTLFHA